MPIPMNRFGVHVTAGVLAGVGLVLLSAGCAVGPKYRPPVAKVPPGYHSPAPAVIPESEPAPGPARTHTDLPEWWRVFGDPVLDSLVEEAAGANLEIRLAEARLREARALRGVARAGLFPQVDLDGRAARVRVSGNTPDGRVAEALGQDREAGFLSGGFDVSWEVDVFGGRRRADEAARADVEAAEARANGARIKKNPS